MNEFINPEMVTLFGTLLAFIGTVVLAFSMGRVFWELRFALKAISATIESFVSGGDVYVFKGLEKRIAKALKASKCPTLFGLFLVAISIPIQGYSLYLSSSNTVDLTESVQKTNKLAEDNKLAASAISKDIISIKSEINGTRYIASTNRHETDNLKAICDTRAKEISRKVSNLKVRLNKIEKRLEEMHNVALAGDAQKTARPLQALRYVKKRGY